MKHTSRVNLWVLVGLLMIGMAFAAQRVVVAEMITDET
jgi:hypothetical protein